MSKKKIIIPPKKGMPKACIVCGGFLHRKSEHYCSLKCESGFSKSKKPPFKSKWKMRKHKEANDPTIVLRRKTQRKTRDLVTRGKMKRKPCVVCKSKDTLPHHEDYNNPFRVIWICESHHKAYHSGEISLFNGKLRWDPARLTNLKGLKAFPKKKYHVLKEILEKKKEVCKYENRTE